MDIVLVHLNALHCSGLAVKVRPLDPDVRDEILDQAAKAVGPEATMIALKSKEWKLGVYHMIQEVTVGPVKDPRAPEVKWKKVNAATLDAEYSTLFTAKDHAILKAMFRMYNDVAEEEINAIVGKALTVSED